jgi:hypothetical protein
MYRQGDILILAIADAEMLDAQAKGQRVGRENGQLIVSLPMAKALDMSTQSVR